MSSVNRSVSLIAIVGPKRFTGYCGLCGVTAVK